MGHLRPIGSVQLRHCSKERSWLQVLAQTPQHMEMSPRLLLPPLQPVCPTSVVPLSGQTAKPGLLQLQAPDGTKGI